MSLIEKNEPRLHLVDGHNLLHFSNKLKKLYKINPQLSLQNLVSKLVNWANSLSNSDLVIYLDGYNQCSFSLPKQVKLFQSGPDKTADELIIAHAQKWAKKSIIVVHTQDRELQKKLRSKGIFTSDNKSLATILFSEEGKTKAASESVSAKQAKILGDRAATAQEVDEMMLFYHLREMDESDDKKKPQS